MFWPIFIGGAGMEGAAGGGGGVAAAIEVPEGAGGDPAPGPAAVLISRLSGAGPPAILPSALGSGFAPPPSSFLAGPPSSFFATTSSFLAGASAFTSSFLGGASATTLGAPTSTSPSAFTATISTPNDSILPSDILACWTSTVA